MNLLVIKRIVCVALIFCTAFFTTGCWNRRELNTLGIVGAMGVEKVGGNVRITAEVTKTPKATGGMAGPAGGGGGDEKKPVRYVTAEGESVFDAIRNITLRSDRKLFYPHARAYLYSDAIAREGLASYMDMIYRDHELRLKPPFIIVKDGTIAEVMGITPGIDTIPSKHLQDLFRVVGANSKGVRTSVLDFMKQYKGKGKQPVVGIIEKRKKAQIASGDEPYELVTEGAAVFLGDRLVGYLDGEETRVYNALINKIKSSVLTIATPGGKGDSSLELFKVDSKMDVEFKDGVVRLKVKIKIIGMLDEEEDKINLKDRTVIAAIENAMSESFKQQVEAALGRVQRDYRSDIFGFGQVMHRKYPQEWRKVQDNWDEIFAEAGSEVEVNTKISKTGRPSDTMRKE